MAIVIIVLNFKVFFRDLTEGNIVDSLFKFFQGQMCMAGKTINKATFR